MLDTSIRQEQSSIKLLPKAEAARILGISKQALQKRIDRGSIPAQKVDGCWFVELPEEACILDRVSPLSIPSIPTMDDLKAEIIRLTGELAKLEQDRDAWREVALKNAHALGSIQLPSIGQLEAKQPEKKPWILRIFGK